MKFIEFVICFENINRVIHLSFFPADMTFALKINKLFDVKLIPKVAI